MTIHPINLDNETTIPILRAAKPLEWNTLDFEAAIIAHWAVRWDSATPHERQKMMDSLRITLNLGEKQHG